MGARLSNLRKYLNTVMDPVEAPYVMDNGPVRSLYFDGRAVQSSMCRNDPYGLEFGYARAMMSFMLFQSEPKDILIIGLGGGSLSKFCHKMFPDTVITTVEISAAVIALRDDFLIPPDNEHFRVVHADAVEYLQGRQAIADVLLLDGFDADGLPEALSNRRFYAQCHRALREGGILTANVWHENNGIERYRWRLEASFGRNVVAIKPQTGGDVAVAFKDGRQRLRFNDLQEDAIRLQQKTGLNFPRYLEEMRRSDQGGRLQLHD